ncbi:MAG: insulinase family protein [Cytophagales bacterium]|nr:insulinase family protein [Cytophagales bacterium]
MTLDRSKAPFFQEVSSFSPVGAKQIVLDNQVPVYHIQDDAQALVRIEVIFEAGGWCNPQASVASTTAKLLSQGTESHTSLEIAKFVEKYGASLNVVATPDHFKISLFTLSKYVKEVLPVMREIMLQPSFPKEELDLLKERMRNALKTNLQKGSYVASTMFTREVLGSSHPYTNHVTFESIEALQRDIIVNFFEEFILGKKFEVFIAGSVDEDFYQSLNTCFGDLPNQKVVKEYAKINASEMGRTIHEEREDLLQTSIRIGRPIISRKHEDYFALAVLNEVLGGFFGSRLMKNIREDKGYTYGINSYLTHHQKISYWGIGTDVKKEAREDTLFEIYKEIDILQNELISDKELRIVKNHLTGELCTSFDTCFDWVDRFKVLHHNQLPDDYEQKFLAFITKLDAFEIRNMARKYLQKKDLVEISIG